ncbi:MAG: SpoIID/LytB domain-containing protein [Bacteriovoracaceae bacterium]|nr:SpoIID/LytB domain-containing protein [Bacteriovoracaceae bacterium]
MIRQGLFLILISVSAHAKIKPEPSIKVRIAKSLENVWVRGIDLKKNLHLRNEQKEYQGRKTLNFKCKSTASGNIKRSKPVLLASVGSNTGIVGWDDKKYKGELLLVANSALTSCDLVNEISLETYISSLLSKEVKHDWPEEALKAQAVAARTYAYHKIETKEVSGVHGHETYYDLENSEKHQVNGTALDETSSTQKAAKNTKGEVLLTKAGKLTPTFFHSKCGGKTVLPQNVWAHSVEGYRSIDCPFCNDHGKKDWKILITDTDLKKMLNEANGSKIFKNMHEHVTLIPDDKEKLNIRFYKNGDMYKVKKADLRKVVGRAVLPSNNFILKPHPNGYMAEGSGFGHGVGMCQFGAFEMAKRGFNYRQILAYYFPGHKIEKIY